MVMGGIVPVVNLEGVKPGDLVLDGPTLAKIFLGDIKTWDDPAIKKLNPSAKLPSARDRGRASLRRLRAPPSISPTTWRKVSADWKSKVGVNTSVEWPVGIGAKGNEGVSNNVGQTKGSIGYVEYAYALQNKLTYTKMVNKDGKTVSPTSDALPGRGRQCRLECSARLWRHPGQSAGAASWPMTAATFILIPKQPQDAAAATSKRSSSLPGPTPRAARWPRNLIYVPMPAKVVKEIEAMWAKSITGSDGKPLHVTLN